MNETTETRDLGFLATVTAYCDTHHENETYGVKGATPAEARDRMALAESGIMADHRLRMYVPSVGKIYPLPIRPQPAEPESTAVEKATTAVHAELEHLAPTDRLLVLRMATRAEEQGDPNGLPIPPCDGGQVP